MGSLLLKNKYREDRLLGLLKVKKRMDTKEVVNLLDISESTARRFLAELERRGVVLRTYGGVRLSPEWDSDYYFDDLKRRRAEQKARIGAYAASLAADGDILFLDSGTTLAAMAVSLSERIREGAIRDIQIYTNSLVNLKALAPCAQVHLIGGLFRSKRQDFCGHLAEMVLSAIAFKKCFLGTDGISLEPSEGIMATDVYTAKMGEIIIGRSDQTYILADSSKFMRRSFIGYAPLDSPRLIITDRDLKGDPLSLLRQSGTSVKRV
jgi:DeoR/GlpR family transcriptional regulator of sugar metabolism